MNWINVKEKPLFIQTEHGWECTKAGEKQFLAAVPTNKGWWIRHCIVEEGFGLCVVEDEDNVYSGWEIEDVTHYVIINEPEIIKEDKQCKCSECGANVPNDEIELYEGLCINCYY